MSQHDLVQLEVRLRHHVEVLAQSPRVPTSRAHRDAEDYIADQLQAAGFAVQEAGYLPEGTPCTNLIARLPPENTQHPLVIIGAHYDTVPDSPGADDNASAVAALLEVARWLGPRLAAGVSALTGRIQLVAYDLEEYGYVGSSIHSSELAKAGAAVRGMISLEMLGYTDQRPGSQQLPPSLAGLYPNVANFIGVCGNEASRSLLEPVVAAMKGIAGLPVESLVVPGCGETLPPVRLSDHASFWDRGYPALMITDTSFMRNPHYHQPSDTPDTLDYPFLAKVTAGVCDAVWRLLQESP
jgi:Zn-dependent M28 family amino/carboxypeptidase